jgi:glycosyltransferase involved in cell wall biosynthesis
VKFVKEVDKIIELFNHTHDPLIIIGNGPDEVYLKSIAHKNIIFIDRIEDKKEMYAILSQAK